MDYPHHCITRTPIHSFLPRIELCDNVHDNKIEQVKWMQDVGSINFIHLFLR